MADDNLILKVLIVDDEPLAIERMQILLSRVDDVNLVATGTDGEAAIRLAEALEPDLVLLDIAMPGMDGIDVARTFATLPKPPAVVFVTAFDSFAVAAFDVDAVDYLMKPVHPDRLARAIERARTTRVAPVEKTASEGSFIEEFWASESSGLVRIAAQDIDKISAERDYMRLHVGARSWLIHHSMSRLEEELDPARFMRLHRSCIVRRDFINGLRREDGGSWFARLLDGSEQKIGRLYLHNARSLTGR